jgi:hypothetical protein
MLVVSVDEGWAQHTMVVPHGSWCQQGCPSREPWLPVAQGVDRGCYGEVCLTVALLPTSASNSVNGAPLLKSSCGMDMQVRTWIRMESRTEAYAWRLF